MFVSSAVCVCVCVCLCLCLCVCVCVCVCVRPSGFCPPQSPTLLSYSRQQSPCTNDRKCFSLSSIPLALPINKAHPLLETIFLSFVDLKITPGLTNSTCPPNLCEHQSLWKVFFFLINQHELGSLPREPSMGAFPFPLQLPVLAASHCELECVPTSMPDTQRATEYFLERTHERAKANFAAIF